MSSYCVICGKDSEYELCDDCLLTNYGFKTRKVYIGINQYDMIPKHEVVQFLRGLNNNR